MIPGRPFRPQDLLLIARRWVQIVLVFAVVGLGTVIYVRQLPDLYRAETLILVVPQRVPESYVRSTVTTNISDRLRSIGQEILSRTRLEPIIREFNLYPKLVERGLMEDVVERMRRDIATPAVRGDAFRISYTSNDPRVAMKVTERLASLYIEENLRDRSVLADGTNQFLESQLAVAKERLIEHETKLEAYNRRFAGQLPAQVQTNLQVLQNAQLQIQSITDSMTRDKDRRMTLESIVAETEGMRPSDPGAASGPTPAAGAPAMTAGVSSTLREIDTANTVLQALLLRLKPEHPDVVRQRRIIADLQQKLTDERAMAAIAPAGGRPAVPAPPIDRMEAARMARLAQARMELDTLNKQLPMKEAEEARLRTVVAEYQSRVEAAPTRASELIELTRDYDTLRSTYTALLRKKEDAQLAANLERYQIGEQFKILDPARMPERPISPDRPRLYSLGALLGLGLGLALATFLEFRDTSLKTDADVVLAISLPVLALIPALVTDEERASKRKRLFISCATASMVCLLGGVLFWVFRA